MEDKLYQQIHDAAIEVHKSLGGPGLLESIYECALCHELTMRGLSNQRQVALPVIYKESVIREPLYIDILVEKKVIIEVKATGLYYPYYYAQLNTYLQLSKIPNGILINFGKVDIEEGFLKINRGETNPHI